MTTYYLFAGLKPQGGWHDFMKSYYVRVDAIGAARVLLETHTWAHIVADGEIIWQDGHDGPKQG